MRDMKTRLATLFNRRVGHARSDGGFAKENLSHQHLDNIGGSVGD